jgi:hypothetical protein
MAVRTASWRALHREVDSPPHVFEDRVGVLLAAPEEGWRNRSDIGPFPRLGLGPFVGSGPMSPDAAGA